MVRKIAREQAKLKTKQEKTSKKNSNKNIFQNFSSNWVRYDKYEWRTSTDGKCYITPAVDAKPSIYNPIKNYEKLVLTAINVGTTAMSKASESELKEAIMGFVSEYGMLSQKGAWIGSIKSIRLIYTLLLFFPNPFNNAFPTHLFKLILWYHIRNPNQNRNHKHTWHYRKMQPEEKCCTERIY